MDSMLVKANYFIQKNCLICRFVLYDVNVPQEQYRFLFFFFSVSVGLVWHGVWWGLLGKVGDQHQNHSHVNLINYTVFFFPEIKCW